MQNIKMTILDDNVSERIKPFPFFVPRKAREI